MKKWFIIFLFLIMSSFICACSAKTSNEIKPPKKSTSFSYKELDSLPKNYDSELAQKNGDVVGIHLKIYNIEKLDKFMELFKKQKTDIQEMVRVTTYTVEGDAIIHDLIISNKGMKLIEDNTRDKFSNTENRIKREYKVIDFYKQNGNNGISYVAKTSSGEEIPILFVYSK